MKKILFVIFASLIFSGCSYEYELYYKKPNKIIESANITLKNDDILLYNDSVEDYFVDIFNGWKKSYGLKKYDYVIEEGNGTSSIAINKTHDSLYSVFDNVVIKEYFDNINIYKLGDDVVVELSGYLTSEEEDLMGEGDEETLPLNITIKSNYKVISNAKVVDDKKGIYRWTFKESDENKSLKITFTDQINYSAYFNNVMPVLPLLILLVLLGGVVFVIIKYLMNKNRELNKI